ncbi:MAG: PEGA domain-containing protein [Spirochaetales bacterium]|nr:PEGA domain-containing protein [Spirochaetales bacterium]
MLETGLVKTNKFNVLSYNDVEAILEAQAFSLSGCVDDSCAIEVGQLLSVEIIILGELAKIGDGYALNVRMIDVASSRTLGAEAVNFQSPGEMREAGFTAAFSLAGLKYFPGSEGGIQEVGELYITAPEDKAMKVILDGKEVGITPLLLREVNFGTHLLQVSEGDYLFEQEISVNTKELTAVKADNSLLKGTLLLSVDPPILSEYQLEIDGYEQKLGLIADLPAGKRLITITAPGWSYYGEVTIKSGQTIETTLPLKESGWIKIIAPPLSRVFIEDELGRSISLPEGEEKVVPTGKYNLLVEHDDYNPFTQNIEISKMEHSEYEPAIFHTRSYRLISEIEALEQEISLRNEKRKTFQIIGGIITGLGFGGMGALGVGESMINTHIKGVDSLIDEYSTATDPDRINELGINIYEEGAALDSLRTFRDISLYSGGACLLLGGLFFLAQPEVNSFEKTLKYKKYQLSMEEK